MFQFLSLLLKLLKGILMKLMKLLHVKMLCLLFVEECVLKKINVKDNVCVGLNVPEILD